MSLSVACQVSFDELSHIREMNQISPEGLGKAHRSACSPEKILKLDNPFLRIWQPLACISVVLTCFLEMFMAAFDSTFEPLWIIAYLCDAIYVINIALTFYTAYVDDQGIKVDCPSKIRSRYLRTTFVIDILSVLPTDVFALVFPGISPWKRLTQVRLNRLLRFYLVLNFFDSREAELGTNTALVRGLKYLVISLVTTHGLSCAWYAIACEGKHHGMTHMCGVETWTRNVDFKEDTSSADAYLVSLYWAVATATSTGYGDISSTNLMEQWFAVFSMLAGIAVFFGMLLGGITSMLTNFDQQRAAYVHRLNTIKDHLKDYEVEDDLQEQVIGYYEYLWERKKGVLSDGIYDALPLTFQAEISHSTSSNVLSKAPIFKDLGSGFLRMLSLNIHPMLYLPQQIIITRGDVGHQMYYIHRGEVEVLSEEDDETAIATLKSGKLFGEISLICSVPRTATIRAATHCDLLVLDKQDLQSILSHYPEVAERLQSVAANRMTEAETVVKNSTKQEFNPHFQALQPRESSFVKSSNLRNRRQSFAPATPAIGLGPIGFAPIPEVQSRNASIWSLNHKRQRQSIAISESLDVIQTDEAELDALHEFVEKKKSSFFMLLVHALEQFGAWFCMTTIEPNSSVSLSWQRVVLVVTLFVSILCPYMACFTAYDPRAGYFETEAGLVFLTLSYFFTFIFLLDIGVNLRTGVSTPHGTLSDFKNIAKHYCKSVGFLWDVLSVLPLELLCFMEPEGPSRMRIFAFLQLNRVIKFSVVPMYFGKLEQKLDVSVLSVRALKFLIYIVIFSHWIACCLYVSACYGTDCVSDSWIKNWVSSRSTNGSSEVPVMDIAPSTEYIASLYWAAATMTSTGYGDIHAFTSRGRIFALTSMFIGLLLYGYILASMAATLANLDAPRVGFQEKLFAVKKFMKERNLSQHIQHQVISYLDMIWKKTKGCWMPGQETLMHDMPMALQQDIAMADISKALAETPMFRDTDDSFLRALSLKVMPYMFSPGDIMVYAGDMGREMYCIRRGQCQIMTPDLQVVLADLGPGQYFGEIGMLFGDYRTATVQAKTHCEVLQLCMEDLNEALKDFPILQEQFSFVTENRECLQSLKAVCRKRIENKTKSESSNGLHCGVTDSSHHHLKKSGTNMMKFARKGNRTQDYQEPFQSLAPLTRLLACFLMRKTFLPGGGVLKWWTMTLVAVGVVQALVIPLHAAFIHMSIAVWAILYLADLCAWIQLYIGFHTAFYNDDNVVVTHPLSTAKNYLRTNFVLDFISCFPFELIALCAYPHLTAEGLHLFALLRLNRLFQLYRLPLAFSYFESAVDKETGSIRMIKFFFYTVIFLDWLTCVLFLLACPPALAASPGSRVATNTGHMCLPDSWINTYVNTYNPTFNITSPSTQVGTLFIISLYWASATSVSVGYGEISAITDVEMVLALMSMILGVLFFGYIIASVAASLANADAQRARFQDKLSSIQQFFVDMDLQKELQERVLSYYQYVWLRTKGIEPESLFNGLPLSLWGDVTLNLYEEIISKISLFQDTETSFIKMLSKCIRPMLFLKGEYVVKKHDIGSEMFFIHSGAVDVTNEEGTMVFDTMRAGQAFGEVALLFSCPRTASIRAKTNCDVFVLTKQDLDLALDYYPNIKQKIMQIGEERRAQARKRSVAKAKVESVTSQEPEVVEETNSDEESKSSHSEPETQQLHGNSKNASKYEVAEEAEDAITPISSVESTEIEVTSITSEPLADLEVEILSADSGREQEFNENQNNPEGGEDTKEPKLNICQRMAKWNHFIIDHNSKSIRRFMHVRCFVAFISCWFITFEAAYQNHHPAILALTFACDTIFIAAIYIKFHLSYYTDKGDLESDFEAVYKNYLRQPGGFALDLVAALPVELLALAAPPGQQLLSMSYLRLLKLIRLVRLSQYFGKWEQELNINMLLVRLIKFAEMLTLMIHFFACIWYMIACPLAQCSTGSWASIHGLQGYDHMASYCSCVYWCVATMTSTGYGDIRAQTLPEMVFASFVMIVGKFMFGFILGNIASTLANAEANRVQYDQKLTAIKNHMLEQKVPKPLQGQVVRYYDYLWSRNKGAQLRTLFKDAPSCMVSEIALSLTRRMMDSVPVLVNADESFLRQISQKVKQLLFLPGDYIVRKGDVGQEVYFIHHGEVEILTEDDPPEVSEVLGDGGVFGEISLLVTVPRRVTVRAKTNVDLFSLANPDLLEILAHFPVMNAQIEEIAHQRYSDLFRDMKVTDHCGQFTFNESRRHRRKSHWQ